MKNAIRISVGVAALLSAAALANAQTERASPQQGGSASQSRALGTNLATEIQPSPTGAEERGAAAGERGGQPSVEKAERNAAAAREGAEERKSQPGAEENGVTTGPRRTTDQAPEGNMGRGLQQGQRPHAQRPFAQHPYAARPAQPREEGRGPARQGAMGQERPGAQGAFRGPSPGGAAARGVISPDQEARIRDGVRNENAARADRYDFGRNVGAIVPRAERLAVLPPEVVAIVPQYRGYKFVIVEDDIVIVDPRTYRVAAVIPEARGPGFEPPPGPGPERVGPGPDLRGPDEEPLRPEPEPVPPNAL
ncbi:MAG: DUF1236 domain-containing protein [Methylocystis sp.]